MTALPHAGERRCAGCGCVLRQGHDGVRCELCERAHLAYRPQHDPDFPVALLNCLIVKAGHRVNVYEACDITVAGKSTWDYVHAQIRRLKRQGHVIRGHHDGTYVYLGYVERGRLRGSGRASRS